MIDLKNLTISQASQAIAAQTLSPVELVDAALANIKIAEPEINAFVSVWVEEAREQAKQAEREISQGKYRGPLHGIPLALKDLFDVTGKPTTASSKVRAEHIAQSNSAVTDALHRAGAILLGKTHTHEFAFGVITPQTRNPLDTRRIVGGSSGGSAAAVAYGGVLAAMGTDTGGSIRIPAALCGIVGFKPTYGLVSCYGVTPLAWSLDHAGPMSRTVEDAGLVLQALTGFDERDPASRQVPDTNYADFSKQDIKGLRIGIPQNYYFDQVAESVIAAVKQTAERLKQQGAEVTTVNIPLTDYLMPTQWGITVAEAASIHSRTLRKSASLYGDDVRTFFETGQLLPAGDYLKAQRARRMICQQWNALFNDIDILLTPTVPETAALVGQESFIWSDNSEENVTNAYLRLCIPANITGLPALTLPVAKDKQGLPIGIQVIGRAMDDATVLRVGHAIEMAGKTESV
ncbi:amidase [Xenorhabdus sp. PB30.3]|uniref:amidase n=1 Tax=Xenorhabdus sp. PB30.3 TaxID=2788941 RepID=UPI001E5DFE00|nr:amidase [Xenorhabdus sp. PB30.3]MCC8380873.1 Asp-tRNA(Asn)/Glu-tRNA(Gln) amidotransferase GatCAB subunit A [Xenorhabdus sp. PB30.3]